MTSTDISVECHNFRVCSAGHEMECCWLKVGSAAKGTVVLLHEGLGSAGLWRDFPARLAAQSGFNTLTYSRYGNGFSSVLIADRAPGYMHEEAQQILPDLLDQLCIDTPVLVGHSDGASIALIFAGTFPARTRGVIAIAPHLFVEPLTIASIQAAKSAYETTDLRRRLMRHHTDGDRTFYGWNDIWLSRQFLAWNIEEFLPHVSCPTLAVQGEEDQYGTMRQVSSLQRLVRNVQVLRIPSCGHSPHREQPEKLLERCTTFLATSLGDR